MSEKPVSFELDSSGDETEILDVQETVKVKKVHNHGLPTPVAGAERRCRWGKRLMCRSTCAFYERGIQENCQLTEASSKEIRLREEAEEREKKTNIRLKKLIRMVESLESRVVELLDKYEPSSPAKPEPKPEETEDDAPVHEPPVDNGTRKKVRRKKRSRTE